MNRRCAAWAVGLAGLLHIWSPNAQAQSQMQQAALITEAPSTALIGKAELDFLRKWLEVPVVRLTLEERNRRAAGVGGGKIDQLDKQWRAETKSDDQPLIASVLSGPLSSYLLRIQAQSLGLYAEIFVMDRLGLNAGQSAITTDYWQGDEAKFQKTFPEGPDAIFIDEAEVNDDTGTTRAQVNMTLTDEKGNAIGAATVEFNLTELQRRKALGL